MEELEKEIEEMNNEEVAEENTVVVDETAAKPVAPQVNKNWYIVTAYSSHENKVKENLELRRISHHLEDYIFRIIVAEEEIPVMKQGKPTGKTKLKNIYPGYIFIEMIMNDETWYMVRNTPGVTGFIGSSGGGAKPFPVVREQIETVLKKIGMVDESMFSEYKVGDYVRILNGSLEGSEGSIVEIDTKTGVVTLSITFLGRPSLVQAEISQIDKQVEGK